jgi:hypothetical protein
MNINAATRIIYKADRARPDSKVFVVWRCFVGDAGFELRREIASSYFRTLGKATRLAICWNGEIEKLSKSYSSSDDSHTTDSIMHKQLLS